MMKLKEIKLNAECLSCGQAHGLYEIDLECEGNKLLFCRTGLMELYEILGKWKE